VIVRAIYDIYKTVKIPVIGTGGVTNGQDAIEMMMAGASFIGVGTAVYYRGQKAFGLIANEMEDWLKRNRMDLRDVIGAAHE
jgi:dihydroorotate dehydrogenase (NAD+) catalytic subunit